MVGLILTVIVFGSMVWVYLDASGHKIGKIPSTGGFLNLSAGAWGTATGFIWIIGFPAYLLKRSALIETARTHPVDAQARLVKALVFGAIAIIAVGINAANLFQSSTLPGMCAPRRGYPCAENYRSVGTPTS